MHQSQTVFRRCFYTRLCSVSIVSTKARWGGKVLCQHGLLMNKVTGSPGEGAETNDGSRFCVEGQKGGTWSLSGLLRRLTPQSPQSISPVLSCLPTFADRNHFAAERINHFLSQPPLAPTSIPPACLEKMSWWWVEPSGRLSLTCLCSQWHTHDIAGSHQKNKHPSVIYGMLSQPCAGRVRIRTPAAARMHART